MKKLFSLVIILILLCFVCCNSIEQKEQIRLLSYEKQECIDASIVDSTAPCMHWQLDSLSILEILRKSVLSNYKEIAARCLVLPQEYAGEVIIDEKPYQYRINAGRFTTLWRAHDTTMLIYDREENDYFLAELIRGPLWSNDTSLLTKKNELENEIEDEAEYDFLLEELQVSKRKQIKVLNYKKQECKEASIFDDDLKRCMQWQLEPLSILEILKSSKLSSFSEMDVFCSVLPCEYTGDVIINKKLYQYQINAGGFTTLRRKNDYFYLIYWKNSDFFLEDLWNPEMEE